MSLQYRLLRRVESGVLAEHFEATTDTGNTVMVKLFAEQYSDPEYGRHLQDTAHILNPIDAPALLRYLEIGVVNHRLAVTRESVDGFSFGAALTKLNTRDVVLPSTIALFWMVELLDAVERAHQAGLVHGAITPGNALITRAGDVRICDFGTLEALQASPVLRKAFGGESGRASYRAPEILKGEQATPESDVYSIAALTYELLTLREPARGAGMSTRRDALPPPSRIDRRLNGRIDPILMRALEPAPNRRFKSCAEFSQGLRKFLSENGGIPNADELRRCCVELAPATVAGGPVPFSEPFTLQGLEGDDLDELPERSAVMTLRPSFSGGALGDAEYPEAASTQESPPAFAEFKDETRNGRPPAPKEEPAQVDTNPGQAGPLEAGWEAPPGTAVYKPKRKDNERSIVGAAPQRHPRVKVVEDFQGPPLAASKPAPRADNEASVSRSGRRDPERSRVRAAPRPPEPEEYPEPSYSASQPRPLRTAERKLIETMRKNQRLLLMVSIIALLGALGFAFAIWQLRQDRDRRTTVARPRPVVTAPEPAPVVVRPPPVEPKVEPEVVKPPPPPPKPVQHEVALYVPPPRSTAGFLTIIANVPARVYIDGAQVPKRTPLKKYPVHPGSRLVVVEAVGTGDRRVFNVNVVRGKLRKINELDLAARPSR